MKFKSLMLGSAAFVATAGGAYAADLTIAEPVDYVRVCDAFGTGYWYIPGTDTCLKVGGSVQFDIKFQKDGWNYGEVDGHWVIDGKTEVVEDIDVSHINVDSAGNDPGDTQVVETIDVEDTYVLQGYWDSGVAGHSSHWKFVTEAVVDFTAKSMTEYGPLVGYVKFKGVYDPTNSDGVVLDEAYLSLGHVLFGHTASAANFSDGYAPGAWHGDTSTNQIKLSWAAAGFGLQLGIEDPRERWGTSLTDGDDMYSMPDITGNITVTQGHWNAKLIAGYSVIEEMYGPNGKGVYGIGGTLEAKMDVFSLMVGGAYGTGTSYLGTGKLFSNHVNQWTAFVSGKWQATPTFSLAGSYAVAGADGMSNWTAGGAKLVWSPVAGFEAYAEGKAWKMEGEDEHLWEGKVGVKRSW
jgi:hypothetical protein